MYSVTCFIHSDVPNPPNTHLATGLVYRQFCGLVCLRYPFQILDGHWMTRRTLDENLGIELSYVTIISSFQILSRFAILGIIHAVRAAIPTT